MPPSRRQGRPEAAVSTWSKGDATFAQAGQTMPVNPLREHQDTETYKSLELTAISEQYKM